MSCTPYVGKSSSVVPVRAFKGLGAMGLTKLRRAVIALKRWILCTNETTIDGHMGMSKLREANLHDVCLVPFCH